MLRRQIFDDTPVSKLATWSGRCGLFSLAVAALSVVILRSGLLDIGPALATFGAALVFAALAILLAFASFVTIWRQGLAGLGYSLLGACWLVRKCEGEVRDAAYRLIPYLSLGLLGFLFVVFAYALGEHLQVMGRWLERPYLFVFPWIGIMAAAVLAVSVKNRLDGPPFYMVTLIFIAAFGTLAISFWPYMIPFAITIEEAASPHSSLAFMFWGEGLFVFPLMLLYTAISLSVFRGKVRATAEHY